MKILVVGDFQGKFPNKLKRKFQKEEFDLVICVGDIAGLDDWKPWIMARIKAMKKGMPTVDAEEYFGKKRYKELLKKEYASAKKVYRELDKLGKPIIYVFGNTDDGWYNYPFGMRKEKAEKNKVKFLKKLKNFININYKSRKYKEINFVGFGGYMDLEAFTNPKTFQDKESAREAKKRLGESKKKLFNTARKVKGDKIFVFHYPPKGVFDIIKSKGNPMNRKSAGVQGFTNAIKRFKPKLVLCGHMHEYQGKKKFFNTIVVNPGDSGEGKYAVVDWPSLKVKVVK